MSGGENATRKPEVTVIVVSYNTRDMTLECLESLRRETKTTDFELIVVDNASADGSAEAIAVHQPHARLIALEENIGFAAANNLAARSASGRYLLLLNPDTVIRNRAVDRLVDFARCTPAARIWGGRTLFADLRLNPSSCWARMTPWNQFCRTTGLAAAFPASPVFNGEAYGGWARDDVRHVDIVSGCFLLIESRLWRALGGFDLSLFMYGEDADLCLRAAHLGATPLITPTAEIIHHAGASENVRAAKLVRLLTAKASLIRKHWPSGSRSFGLRLLEMWPLSRWLATTIAARWTHRADLAESAATWRAVCAARADWRRGWRLSRSNPAAPAARPSRIGPARAA